MKKQLLSNLSVWLIATVFVSDSLGQDLNYKVFSPNTFSSESNAENVNTRVVRAFLQLFTNATNLVWEEKNKNYLVDFIQYDQQNKAVFAKNGNLVYHIRYGNEVHLPKDVRILIKREYFDQEIIRVLKVNQEKRNIWVVTLEDNKEYIYVRVEDMELEETKRIQKGL